jgi:radical SAM superfamily enzyme YgiQ (UPF0313 family)
VKIFLFLLGLVVLIAVEIARVYFIMPFPGSQVEDTIDLAYFLHSNIIGFGYLASSYWPIRPIGLLQRVRMFINGLPFFY